MEIKATHVLLLLVSLCFSSSMVSSKKILMLPVMHTSHVNFFAVAGEALAEQGHEVTVVTHPRNKKVLNRPSIKSIYVKESQIALDSEQFQSGIFQLSLSSAIKISGLFSDMMTGFCESILGDEALMKELQETKFDLAIVEGDPPGFCLYVIPYKLDVPYISLAAIMNPWPLRVSSLPSVEPMPLRPKTNDMNFLSRVENTLVYIACHFVAPTLVSYSQNYIVSKYATEKPMVDVQDLHSKAQLWLVNWEPFILDYPRASTPYYHYVGGIGTNPAKPLSAELENFVQAKKNGCIVLTFGSAIKKIPLAMMTKFIDAFRKTELNVIITNGGEDPQDIPQNVKIQTWLPQNDILGHPNIKLFITHGGNNGQLEALYHGVPQIVFPIFGDQQYNAMRVERKGYGLKMDVHDFTAEQLHQNIKRVLADDRFKANARKASKIFRSLPSAKDKIVFWVDHILKFGGEHLRPSYLDMPLYKFLMLDVAAFFLFVITMITYIVKTLWKCCCRLCKKKIKKG